MARAKRPLADRFWEKVDASADCWNWLGANDKGYGLFWVDEIRRAARAHRVAYELLVGGIPEGMTLDHLCRNRRCVNPDHLEPCSSGENARRSPLAPYNIKARQTKCADGHPFDDVNTARYNGRRSCKVCNARRERERQATCKQAAQHRRRS